MSEGVDVLDGEDGLETTPAWDTLGWRVPTGVWALKILSLSWVRTKSGDPYLRLELIPECHLEVEDDRELSAFEVNGRGATIAYSIFEPFSPRLDNIKKAVGVHDSMFMTGKIFTARYSRDSRGFTVLTGIRPYRRQV